MKEFFWPAEVREVTGVTYRQLQYWDRTGFLQPEAKTGSERRYTYADLVAIHAALIWKEHGMSIQRARSVLPDLLVLLRGSSTLQLATGRLFISDEGAVFTHSPRLMMTSAEQIRFRDADLEALAERVKKLDASPFVD